MSFALPAMFKNALFFDMFAQVATIMGACFFHRPPGQDIAMPQTPGKRQCCNCYYSRRIKCDLVCVKNPPAVDTKTGLARWPVVGQADFCGCFRLGRAEYMDHNHRLKSELPIYRDGFGDYCKIPLTQGRYAKIDPDDYIWLSQFRWHCKSNMKTIYAVRTVKIAGKSKRIFMHRLIADTPANLVCDHINHDGLDNRRANLRNCTIRQNNTNSRAARTSTSKYKGVSWNRRRGKWVAYIKKDGRQRFLGSFTDQAQAAKSYYDAAKELHGRFAALNFPE
jgi:hypothetical protein